MIETWFPDRSANRPTKTAIAHADDLAVAFDREPSCAPDSRLVVNMLRHEYIDYDMDQFAERHTEACDAIAAARPWLADECASQKARRMAADAECALMLAEQAAQDAEWKEAGRRLIEASKVAAKTLTVGQQVSLTVGGHARVGTIAAVARSMVTVDYQVKTGAARQVKVHAGLVSVVAT